MKILAGTASLTLVLSNRATIHTTHAHKWEEKIQQISNKNEKSVHDLNLSYCEWKLEFGMLYRQFSVEE